MTANVEAIFSAAASSWPDARTPEVIATFSPAKLMDVENSAL
jgi:hypothetical protein